MAQIVAPQRARVMAALHENTAAISKFGVRSLSLFGSVACDEADQNSDIDMLVDFEGIATFDRYMGLKFYLEDLLGRKIDLVTRKALRNELRSLVELEAIRVA